MSGKVQPRASAASPRRLLSRDKFRGSSVSMLLLGNESWQLFDGMPKHYTLRTRIRMKLKYSSFGFFWEISQTLFAVLVSGFYVQQTYYPDINMRNFDLAAVVVFSIDYLLHLYCSERRLYFVFSIMSVMDIITIVPTLIDHAFGSEENGTGRTTFPFLRFIRVLRLLRLLRLIRATGTRSISAVQKQIHTIVLLIVCIVFISAGVFHAVENTNRSPQQPQITFGDALYYLIVTVTTVGYGDIAPLTTYGKVVAAGVIIVAFTIIPTELSRLTQLMALQSPFRRTYRPQIGNPHVLVVGHVIDHRCLLHFFKELYHPDRLVEDGSSNALSEHPAVIMGPDDPSESVINMLDHPVLQNRVTFIKGSAMSDEDLFRVGADHARACFVLVDKNTRDADDTDSETLLRLLAIRNYNPTLEIYTQIVNPTYSEFISDVNGEHVICIDQVKLSVMAKSCLCPGLATLISNLFRSSTVDTKHKHTGWEREYVNGLSLEVYATALPPAFFGLTFAQACDVLYRCTDGDVLLLGVLERRARIRVRRSSRATSALPNLRLQSTPPAFRADSPIRLYINPGNTLTIGSGQIVYVLSESKKLTQPDSVSDKLKAWLSAGNSMPLPRQRPKRAPESPSTESKTTNISPEDVGIRVPNEEERCVVIEKAVNPSTGENLENHIVVVADLHEPTVCTFLSLLRLSRHVRGSPEYHPILFLSWSSKATAGIRRIFSEYDDVFLMLATGDSKSEFLRANILMAKACVLLADKRTIQQIDGQPVDRKTIFHYLAILRIQTENGLDNSNCVLPMVELTIPRTMKILDTALTKRTLTAHMLHQGGPLESQAPPLDDDSPCGVLTRISNVIVKKLCGQRADVGTYIQTRKQMHSKKSELRQQREDSNKKPTFDFSSTVLLPFFAAGYGFSDDIFDNLICQSFFTPGLMRFVYELLYSEEGKTSREFRTAAEAKAEKRSGETNDADEDGVVVSSLTQVPVPASFVGKSYGELLLHLLSTKDIVSLGLYRGSGMPFSLPYVVTGPPTDTVLANDDLVFVLAQPHSLDGALRSPRRASNYSNFASLQNRRKENAQSKEGS